MKCSYRSQFPSVWPKMIEKLDLLGIHTVEELKSTGAEWAMQLYIQLHGWRKTGMCSCLAYAFEGIMRDCKRYDIPKQRKIELTKYTQALKKRIGLAAI
jgi:hypothetical protein